MAEFLASSTAQLIMMLAICAALAAAGVYAVARYRRGLHDEGPNTSDLMTNFRELYSRGELSDEEYRTIKTTLASRFQKEISDTGDEG